MGLFRRKKRESEPVFTGNCYVRQHTGDGHFVGRCYHSTYNDVCPVHGNVGEWLADKPTNMSGEAEIAWLREWPRDYEL